RYPKTVWANNVIDALNINARSLRNALLQKDPKLIEAELKRVTDAGALASANMERLTQTINLPAGQKALQRAIEARQAYQPLLGSLIEMIKQGRTQQAVAFLMDDMREAQNAYFAAMEELIEVQGQDMEDTAQAADEAYDLALTLTMTLSLTAVLLGLGIAFFVTRSITRPIAESVAVAKRLAEGDLSVRIEADSQDETGQLKRAMQTLVEKLNLIISEVRDATDNLASASEQVSATAQTLSQAASEQAASV